MKFIKLGLLAGIWAFSLVPVRAVEPIRIGVIGPFTRGSGAMGVSMLQGIKIAADEINDQANNDLGAQIAKDLTENQLIDAAVGFVNTGVALAALPYFQEARTPLVLSVTTGSLLTRQFAPPEYAENYIFRVSANTTVEVVRIVEIAMARGYQKIAIFADTTGYGQVGRHDLIKALAARGITPVSNEKFNIGDTDMTEQLTRAREAGADVILTYGIGPELAAIANSRAKLGWEVPMIGSWTLSMSNFIDAAGPNGVGVIMPQTFIEDGDTEEQAVFIRNLHATYKTTRMDSPPAAAQGHDSLYLLAAAIKQAGTLDGPKVRAALDDLQETIKGVVQVYSHPFDPANHEAVSAANVVYGIVKDGRVVRLRSERSAAAQ